MTLKMIFILILLLPLIHLGCAGDADPLRGYNDVKSQKYILNPKLNKTQVVLDDLFRIDPLHEGPTYFVVGEESRFDFRVRSFQPDMIYSVVFEELPEGAKIEQLDPENKPHIYTLTYTPEATLLEDGAVVSDFFFLVDFQVDDSNSDQIKNLMKGIMTQSKVFYRVQAGRR